MNLFNFTFVLLFLSNICFAQWTSLPTAGSNNVLTNVQYVNSTTAWAVGTSLLKTTNSGINWTTYPLNFFLASNGISAVNNNVIFILDDSRIHKTTNGGVDFFLTTSNAAGTFYSIKFVNELTGIVTATGGKVYKTNNGGDFWSETVLDQTTTLKKLFFLNDQTGWIGAINGKVWKTENAGNSWSAKGNTGHEITSIMFVNDTIGFAVGPGKVSKTIDGGINWQFTGEPNTGWPAGALNSVFFFNKDTGSVAGINNLIYRTTNGGINWTLPSSGISNHALNSIDFYDKLNGIAVGNYGNYYITTNGGTNWIRYIQRTGNYRKIHFLDHDTGYVAGVSSPDPQSPRGFILKTTNGGTNWTFLNTGNAPPIHSACFLNQLTGWAAGEGGTIIHTQDAGNSWALQTTNVSSNLYDIKALNNDSIIAVGDLGTIIISSNRGNNWESITGVTSKNLRTLFVNSNGLAWAAGDSGIIIRSTDFGENWTELPSTAINSISSVFFLDYLRGFFTSTGGIIRRTVDGGDFWFGSLSNTTSNLNSIFFPEENVGFATGVNGVFLRTTTGAFWENLGTISPGNVLSTMSFINKDTGWVAGGNYILKTTSGGVITSVEDDVLNLEDFHLFQNFPNPFNPSTVISFLLSEYASVKLEVFDVLGSKIDVLFTGEKPPGKYSFNFNSGDYSSGVYFYSLSVYSPKGNLVFKTTNKMILLK